MPKGVRWHNLHRERKGLQEGKELPDQEIKGTMVLGTTVPSGGHWAPLLGATSIHLGAMPPPPPGDAQETFDSHLVW